MRQICSRCKHFKPYENYTGFCKLKKNSRSKDSTCLDWEGTSEHADLTRTEADVV